MLKNLTAVAFIVCSFLWQTGHAQAPDMSPFAVEWPAQCNSPADLSFLLDAPAGKAGFIRSANGHLVRPDGTHLRFWGVNATGKAGLPEKAEAPAVAANLARLGLNCVRFHFLDRPAPNGIIDAKRNDTRALDPAQLDRLDFFIAELKKRGIYSDLNLNVARPFKAGDGVPDADLLGFAKAVTWFDARLIELQKEYARQLLTHRNPYTGNEYRNEPAVAIVELMNENSLVEAWFDGRLLGQNTTKNPGTWGDIPASYANQLTQKYNAWLESHLSPQALSAIRKEAGIAQGELIPRLQPNQFSKASKDRFRTEAAFYMDVEQQYVQSMKQLLRDDLKIQPLLIANSDHAHHKSGYPQLAATSQLDIVDGHVYWQHPRYIGGEGRRAGFEIDNTPMVDDPLHSTVVQLARSAFAGKPYTVSEVNHPFPAEHASEGMPILAAYAAFQDWDGIFWYTLGHDRVASAPPQIRGHFDLYADPVKMSQLAAGTLMFLRGDVHPARETVERSYSREQVYDSIRLPWSQMPLFTPGLSRATPLRHGLRIQSLNGPATGKLDSDETGPLESDTGELTWRYGAKRSGLVIVNTDRTQATIGFGKSARETRNMKADLENDFCALTLSSLDTQAIPQSARLLVTACGRVANTGMKWNDARKTLEAWGGQPTCIEVIRGTLILKGLQGATQLTIQPLDGAGRPLGGAIPATHNGENWSLPLGQRPTTWYVVNVAR